MIEIINQEDRQFEVLLQNSSYGQTVRRIKVLVGSTSVAEVDLSKQHYWHEVKVTCTG